jgi:predicted Zn-dependent protease
MNIYEHHKTKASSLMIADILTLADPYFRLSKSKLPISLACYDADAYLKLKDSIIDIIEENDHELLKDAKDLIERYRKRKLYKTISEQKISTSATWTLKFWEMEDEMIKQELISLSDMIGLSSADIIVEKLQFHFGMKSENRKYTSYGSILLLFCAYYKNQQILIVAQMTNTLQL